VEPVTDGGADGHSLFAFYLINALKENDREVIDLENLFHTKVWKPVTEIGNQRPNVGRLKTPMDRDGQFVLYNQAWVEQQRAKAEAQRRLEAERQAAEDAKKQKAVRADQMAAVQAERQRLELERQKLEMEKQLANQRQALELDKLKLERERLEMQKEKFAASTQPRQSAPVKPLQLAARQPAKATIPAGTGKLPVALLPVLKEYRNVHWSAANAKKALMVNGIDDAIRMDKKFELRYVFEEDDLPALRDKDLVASSDYKAEIAALWKKNSFFDSNKSPQKDIAIDLAKKLQSDLAVLLNIWFEPDMRIIANLYVIDVNTGVMINKTIPGKADTSWGDQLKSAVHEALKEIE
jgi:hypothetical protein